MGRGSVCKRGLTGPVSRPGAGRPPECGCPDDGVNHKVILFREKEVYTMSDHTQALLLVDCQNDFFPGGALPVPGADEIIPVINRYIDIFSGKGALILASRDWHPGKTDHFERYGGDWPVHCVKNTVGAAFNPDLDIPDDAVVVSKGEDPGSDSYSAFFGTGENGTDLRELLERHGVREIFVAGLATDYCVKSTVLHALEKGFQVKLLVDAVRGVNANEEDAEKAIREMETEGAETITIEEMT